MTNVDDHISGVDHAMDKGSGRKCHVAEELIVILVDDAFTHLSCHKRNAGVVNLSILHVSLRFAAAPISSSGLRAC